MRGEWKYLLDLGLRRSFENLNIEGVQNWSSAQCMKGVRSALRECATPVKRAALLCFHQFFLEIAQKQFSSLLNA